ncbi:hypothetical protein TWF481_010763 [Arthrobotrys musiformis]|uniref:Uncharacterized protein n=1 Tax=Arthrobotrys musiformis TaxID=47236 RepID=A0AAV9W310_9PEZI
MRFLKLSASVDITAALIENALYEHGEGDAVGDWDQYLATFTDAIEPLDNRLYSPDNPVANSEAAKNFVAEVVVEEAPEQQERIMKSLIKSQSTPGLMNRGGTLDPGKLQKPTVVGQRVILRRLFDFTADPSGKGEILLNSGPFLQVWEATYKTITKLSNFEEEIGVLAESTRLRYVPHDVDGGEVWRPITDPYPVGLYNREEIGYDGYFELKYEGTTRGMGTEQELSQRWGMEVSDLDIANMIASYRNQLDGLIRGLLPLIMDMLADIAVKAYDMSKKSRWPRNNWPLPHIEGLDTSIELLRRYPEWSEGQYETADPRLRAPGSPAPTPQPQSFYEAAVDFLVIDLTQLEEELNEYWQVSAAVRDNILYLQYIFFGRIWGGGNVDPSFQDMANKLKKFFVSVPAKKTVNYVISNGKHMYSARRAVVARPMNAMMNFLERYLITLQVRSHISRDIERVERAKRAAGLAIEKISGVLTEQPSDPSLWGPQKFDNLRKIYEQLSSNCPLPGEGYCLKEVFGPMIELFGQNTVGPLVQSFNDLFQDLWRSEANPNGPQKLLPIGSQFKPWHLDLDATRNSIREICHLIKVAPVEAPLETSLSKKRKSTELSIDGPAKKRKGKEKEIVPSQQDAPQFDIEGARLELEAYLRQFEAPSLDFD